MSDITPLGFQRTRLDEILLALQESMITIFGSDINLEPDTVDGETLGIFAEAYDSLTQLVEKAYQNINPQSATGVALSRIVQLNGLKRIGGRKTAVTLNLTGVPNTFIPALSQVSNPVTKDTFLTVTDVILDSSGLGTVEADCTVFGPIIAGSNSVVGIDNPVYGWNTVTNPANGVLGRLEETDEELRVRRRGSTVTPAQSLVDSIYGSLINIPQVVQAVVLENPTGVVDANGQAPHSIHVVVLGGADIDIATIIWQKKSLGVELIGSTVVEVTDSVNNTHLIKFDRPSEVNLYITVNIVMKPGWPTDGVVRIQNELVNWITANQSIGEELIQSRLYDPINNVPGHSITSLLLGLSPSPTSEAGIVVAPSELIVANIDRIIVNVF